MKKYLLGAFALVLAIGFSAFKADKKLATTQFYQFTSTTLFQPGDASTPLNVAANWNTTPLISNPAICNGFVDLCSIQVVTPDGKTPPSFSTVVNQLRTSYDAASQNFILPIIVSVGGVEQYRIAAVSLKN